MPTADSQRVDGSGGPWLVVGAAGQLGTDLIRALPAGNVVGMDLPDIDITRPASVAASLAPIGPSVVINAAAFTAVDAAEDRPHLAWAVNAEGPGVLARACASIGATLLHVSTDYVFDRAGVTQPHEVDAPGSPRSVYGQSKLAGEERVRQALAEHYVVRTAWLYGDTGTNFVKTMARLERDCDVIDVVDDQWGTPTWSADLARGLVRLVRSRAAFGTYHCTNAGKTTWYGLARAVFAELGADTSRVRPCSTNEFPRPAPRPAYSVLSTTGWRAAGLQPLRPWRHALAAAFAEHNDALRGNAVGRAPEHPVQR
jgi:dTDP-4-dehydrorhamnose reductase